MSAKPAWLSPWHISYLRSAYAFTFPSHWIDIPAPSIVHWNLPRLKNGIADPGTPCGTAHFWMEPRPWLPRSNWLATKENFKDGKFSWSFKHWRISLIPNMQIINVYWYICKINQIYNYFIYSLSIMLAIFKVK